MDWIHLKLPVLTPGILEVVCSWRGFKEATVGRAPLAHTEDVLDYLQETISEN